ncbi:hypothetical protein [Nostoc sp. C052]|uniref:hypothetical protein n=1 Tax=Nostoc sp. C052 TaxID=2576902 RepID=UPI0015C30991|nr:hypothetical protein [Nostoc sp. C052]
MTTTQSHQSLLESCIEACFDCLRDYTWNFSEPLPSITRYEQEIEKRLAQLRP